MKKANIYREYKSNFGSKVIAAVVLVAIFVVAFLLGACTSTSNKANAASDDVFEIADHQWISSYIEEFTLVDTDFDVEYIVVIQSNGGISITPRLKNYDER